MQLGEEEALFIADTYADFSNILYVPFGETFAETLNQYYSKLNSFAEPYYFASYIYVAFMIIQQILPVVLFAFDPNTEDSINTIFQVVSPIWCGGGLFGHTAAVITSFVFSLINLLYYIFVIWRAFVFRKMKYVSVLEQNIVLTISKYYIPVSLPFIASGIPKAIQNLIASDAIDPFDIVLIILGIFDILFSFYLIFLYVSPRIMLLHEILSEWDSSAVTFFSFMNVFLTLFSISSQSKRENN